MTRLTVAQRLRVLAVAGMPVRISAREARALAGYVESAERLKRAADRLHREVKVFFVLSVLSNAAVFAAVFFAPP